MKPGGEAFDPADRECISLCWSALSFRLLFFFFRLLPFLCYIYKRQQPLHLIYIAAIYWIYLYIRKYMCIREISDSFMAFVLLQICQSIVYRPKSNGLDVVDKIASRRRPRQVDRVSPRERERERENGWQEDINWMLSFALSTLLFFLSSLFHLLSVGISESGGLVPVFVTRVKKGFRVFLCYFLCFILYRARDNWILFQVNTCPILPQKTDPIAPPSCPIFLNISDESWDVSGQNRLAPVT